MHIHIFLLLIEKLSDDSCVVENETMPAGSYLGLQELQAAQPQLQLCNAYACAHAPSVRLCVYAGMHASTCHGGVGGVLAFLSVRIDSHMNSRLHMHAHAGTCTLKWKPRESKARTSRSP